MDQLEMTLWILEDLKYKTIEVVLQTWVDPLLNCVVAKGIHINHNSNSKSWGFYWCNWRLVAWCFDGGNVTIWSSIDLLAKLIDLSL